MVLGGCRCFLGGYRWLQVVLGACRRFQAVLGGCRSFHLLVLMGTSANLNLMIKGRKVRLQASSF